MAEPEVTTRDTGEGVVSEPRVIGNNDMRQTYRQLTMQEKRQLNDIKTKGQELYDAIHAAGHGRELSLALTKAEEAVMWATKAITR